ncbi:hypothetical protein [Bacteriovorax sp. BAL6_X]|uniref:hypothetical protein n=1 Tax=Bacteriovorax sp. BAL6_X TaxID=1201290 RepID=UPI0012ED54B4|nr:hypothetical protein [Bacteriovorax sp. BAL6_X]
MKFFKIKLVVKKQTSLKAIYSRLLYEEVEYSETYKMVRATKKFNPDIEDWNNLMPQKILLYIDTSKVDINKLYKARKVSTTNKSDIYKKSSSSSESVLKNLKTSVFYMASFGNFDQSKNNSKVVFKQNSSFTLGLSLSYKPNIKDVSFSSSLYYSYLDTASTNLDFGDIQVDAEIGGNFYGNYDIKNNITLYSGLDYERFNTFNIDELVTNSEIAFDKNSVIYFTLGIQKNFNVYRKNVLLKISYSYSMFSSSSSSSEDYEFSGSKLMVYSAMNIYNKFFMHALFKMHNMTGPSDLVVNRFGLGVGYSF